MSASTDSGSKQGSGTAGTHGLDRHGLSPQGAVHWNPSPACTYELALGRGEGSLVHMGAFAAETVPHTGRSPNDKYTVQDATTQETVDWGKVNLPLSEPHYLKLREAVVDHLNQREIFVRDARVGEDPSAGINVRHVSTSAWHSLFAYNMFLRPGGDVRTHQVPDFTILHAPELKADPAVHGTGSSTFVAVNFTRREVLIGGTRYAGEIKKSMFSVLNYLLPGQGILPMHCSANVGSEGDVALFFGLSGTGKTTLSADPARGLIGDDEHGWGEDGVFNFEGGCYAKVINLSPEQEPEIHHATQMFGTILENVVLSEDRREIQFNDGSLTENTRASYPIEYIPNAVIPGRGGHPRNVVFLTCDAFGVLPPIAQLTPEQAMYHFLSGYTAKVAGTERGVTEPKAAFSACFGAPFLPRHPGVYAEMLGAKLREHDAHVWLVNTGWSGGGHGVGKRMKLPHTRTMVQAALDGALEGVPTRTDPRFGLAVPKAIPGVPPEILDPRSTWQDGGAYDEAASRLARMFHENFQKYGDQVSLEIRNAGPRGG
ncbi:MAG: phosphoenolpyruvate carboxykinase (ATP) [Gemmatimonadota bacterium]